MYAVGILYDDPLGALQRPFSFPLSGTSYSFTDSFTAHPSDIILALFGGGRKTG